MIYYVLQGGEWVLNFKNKSTDMTKQATYFLRFKTEPTVEKLKEIFVDLYINDPNVKWDCDVNNKDAIMVQTIIKSKSKIEQVEL
tara:strand:+ start:513 stop:767 length:255 start_codon:yes stop_codon:yes gene_type:complete